MEKMMPSCSLPEVLGSQANSGQERVCAVRGSLGTISTVTQTTYNEPSVEKKELKQF